MTEPKKKTRKVKKKHEKLWNKNGFSDSNSNNNLRKKKNVPCNIFFFFLMIQDEENFLLLFYFYFFLPSSFQVLFFFCILCLVLLLLVCAFVLYSEHVLRKTKTTLQNTKKNKKHESVIWRWDLKNIELFCCCWFQSKLFFTI